MAVSHDPYCDQTHPPRQRCNQALAPTVDALNAFTPVAEPPPAPEPPAPDVVEEPPPPPASPAVREAVVAGTMPAASPYATRAWEDTARALHAPPIEDDDMPPAPARIEPRGPDLRLIGVAIVVVMMLVFLRSRSRSANDAGDGE